MLNHGQPAITETALIGFAGDIVKIDFFEFFIRAVKTDTKKAVPPRIGESAIVFFCQ